MKDLFRSKSFGLGFFLGFLLFALLNVFLPPDKSCYDVYLCANYGFPVPFYQTGMEEKEGGNSISQFLWLGLMINSFISILAGTLVGLSLNLFAGKKEDFE